MAQIERKTGLPNVLDTPEKEFLAEDGEGFDISIEDAVTSETPDGGLIVDFSGTSLDEMAQPGAFDGNLAEEIEESTLQSIAHEIINLADDDEESRAEWRKTYANGLKLLGLKYEQRTEPWENACGAFHPMLLESVIRFNAEMMAALFPGAGPVKTQIIGAITEKKEKVAKRIQRDLNNLATRVIKGFRDETDLMMFNLPLAGTTFRSWRYDEVHRRPAAHYILPEHLLMPYSAASLDSSDRFTIILNKTANWIRAKQASGFYRDTDLGPAPQVYNDPITEEKDRIEGRTNSNDADDHPHRLYECHILYYIEEDPYNQSGEPLPYVITVDSDSHEVLSIRREWREDDPTCERVRTVIQHKYMPGFGPYGIGLINILGGLTESATSILRQLVDAGTLSNLPAGYKAKGMRIKDDSDPIGPGEWRDVEVSAGTLRENFFPLPYKEPSTVLAGLLGQVVDEGRRIGSVADMKVTDMTGQNMPVGTTLAIIERSMKVMTAVQQRLYESFTQELNVLYEIVRDFMLDQPYPFTMAEDEQDATREEDYGMNVDVIPVADPNATTMAQRIMQMQAITQLMQQAPGIYNQKAVHRQMIMILGSDQADLFVPPDEDIQPRDPITENMDLINQKPVKAGAAQNHEAHIAVHMAAIQDPKLQGMMQQNPAAGAIMAAAAAHIQEHLAFQYRKQIETQLGVPLPPPGEPLPEEVEYQLASIVADAAQKLLGVNQMEQQAKQAEQAANDPIIQMQQRELEIKEQANKGKLAVAAANLQDKEAARRYDALKTILKEMSETERSTLAVQLQSRASADKMQLDAAKAAADIENSQMETVASLLLASTQAQAAQASLQQAAQSPAEPPAMPPGMGAPMPPEGGAA
jgi:hypothetical protein